MGVQMYFNRFQNSYFSKKMRVNAARKIGLLRVCLLSVCVLSGYGKILYAEPLDKVVAVVNDNVITERELNTQMALVRKQLLAMHKDIPEDPVLKKQVLQHLIDVELQLQMAKNNSISVDKTELDQIINKIAEDNHLTAQNLRQEIERQGMTWRNYRDNLHKEVLMTRIQQRSVGQDVQVSADQVEDYLKSTPYVDKIHSTFQVQNIVIPLSEAPTTEQLTRAQKKAHLILEKIKKGEDFGRLAIAESSDEFALEGGDLGDRHLAELPEIFAKQVVAMKVGDVVGPIRAGNGLQLIKLVAIHEEAVHHQVTKYHVRHILLKPDMNITEAEAQKQIQNIYQQIKAGKDFALMAKQYSLDASNAINGGDLGWVTPEELTPDFAKAMENLPMKTVSLPVKTPFGWHLIEVLERKTEDDTAAYKRQQVRLFLQQRKFAEAVQTWQQHIRSDAYVKILDKALA